MTIAKNLSNLCLVLIQFISFQVIYKTFKYILILLFYTVYFFSNFAGFISIIIPIDLFFFAWLASDRNTSTTLFLVLLLCFLVAFPLVFWIRACVGESTEATQRIVAYLSNDPDLKDFLEKYKYSYLFEKVSG